MDPSCLVTTVQAGGGRVMVWGMFSWHTFGPLVPIGHLPYPFKKNIYIYIFGLT